MEVNSSTGNCIISEKAKMSEQRSIETMEGCSLRKGTPHPSLKVFQPKSDGGMHFDKI